MRATSAKQLDAALRPAPLGIQCHSKMKRPFEKSISSILGATVGDVPPQATFFVVFCCVFVFAGEKHYIFVHGVV